MLKFDVIIVGAGPAGTAAAWELLDQNVKVLVIDKCEFPRKKACAGGITAKGYNLFKYDISPVVKRHCSKITITPGSGKKFNIQGPDTFCYMTDRKELDYFSLNKIIEKGADFKVIKHIRSIEESGTKVIIKTDSSQFEAEYLIGADGANSTVRKFITKKKFFKKQLAIEADIKVPRPDIFEMEFDFNMIQKGYFWIFPKKDHLNVGLYSYDPSVKLPLDLLRSCVKKRLGLTQLESVKGYPICTGGGGCQFDSTRILLVGDAAGLAEPLFGEGIYFALKSGQMAAAAILQKNHSKESVQVSYYKKLSSVRSDLKLYDYCSKGFYLFPDLSLRLAALKRVKNLFSKGFSDGLTLYEIFSMKKARL